MPTDHRAKLATIKRFDQLIAYLRDEMGWPIARDSFEDVDDLFYDFTADELGIDPKTAAKIQEIKRLRPLSPKQPWGIFFVKFEPKKLPVVALRRILGQVALKKRASANSAERAAWAADDLLFVSNYGGGDERQISFAHFSRAQDGHDLPTLKVLGWDNLDTALHLDAVVRELTEHLVWPDDDADAEAWRTRWRAAFTLRHREVVTTSKELSIRLAELARNIRDRIKAALAIETDKGPLTRLMKAFQTALVHDLDADGFADMYAQTIAYGLLSARIADPHKKTADDFAAHMRTNPFLRELMETFLKVGGRRGKAGGPGIDFDELGVSEVVELLDDANMEAVVRDFGDRNPQEDPVIHFYELFLKEYDARRRMQRGVFYTPRPVVSYIVRSVDELLRTEFGLAYGLADTTTWGEMAKRHQTLKIPDGVSPDQDFVQILDPATGTGTFLVEVIELIHKTLVAKWRAQSHGERKIDALWNEYVPKHLLTRLHGYELLMAPYAIAHLKIGLKLYETGYRFGSDERARVYLTNALDPAQDFSGTFEFAIPALAHEAQAVNRIKRDQRFTVALGNPPYAIHSGNLTPAARAIVDRYRRCDNKIIRERGALQFEKNLQNDYVKFLRFAELVVAASSQGIVGFITSHAFLSNRTLRGMRESLSENFQHMSCLNLHGNSASGEAAELAQGDKNVFDITEGVSISLLRRMPEKTERAVRYADLAGAREHKYVWLSSHVASTTEWVPVQLSRPHLLFKPTGDSQATFDRGVPLDTIYAQRSAGVITARDDFATDESKAALVSRVEAFAASRLSGARLRAEFNIKDKKGWDVDVAQRQARDLMPLRKCVHPYLYRPFDARFIAYNRGIVWGMAYPTLKHVLGGRNLVLIGMQQYQYDVPEYCYAFVSRGLTDGRIFVSKTGVATLFPLYLYAPESELTLHSGIDVNLSRGFIDRFLNATDLTWTAEGVGDLLVGGSVGPEAIFCFIYAQLHAPGYRSRFAEPLRTSFPRIFVPGNLDVFRELAFLGRTLVALHLLESPKLGTPISEFIGGRNPEVEKISWSTNTVWLDKAQTTGFTGVGEDVWNFHIGGYQVCEKWLKDRKGRTLSKGDIAHYQKIVVALSETIRLMKEIDEVIEQHGGWLGAFQTAEAKAAPAKVIPFRPRTFEPKPTERYLSCVPLVPLKAAAGAFSDPQHVEDDGFEWVAVDSRHRLRKGMFVAQVVGKSMEPAIPDGAWCLFRAPVEGTRHGKTVLVQLRDATDPETGQRYTVKRYESEKAAKGDSWRHARITLKPINPDFEPIVLTGKDHGELQVIAELLEVLRSEA
jgi:SOS-response transcriptional repressor LexA